jgi:SpoVK/Ycf46/Vps4 family AAA+-type ATPase
VHVQLLEHDDESRVCDAIHRLTAIIGDEPPKRPQVLDARLRRLEDFADEAETRALAKQLRRHLLTIELPPSG